MSSKRIGVFVCHCGNNIAGTVDVSRVASTLAAEDSVVCTKDYAYMCSDPGQNAVISAIKENALDGVVVSCCSPNLHERTFRENAKAAGINAFTCEIANIREQCAWVHRDPGEATEKAIRISRAALRRVERDRPLEPIGVGVTRRVLVVGGGIAGIQASLDLAAAGFDVLLVEKQATIGGRMLGLSETFPTLDCSQCVLSPKMVEISRHPRITLMTSSEVEKVSGYVGNFQASIRRKAAYVDPDLCKLCDDCAQVCPVVVPNEYELGLSARRAIFMPYAQAIPATYTLDESSCLGLNPIVCGKCRDVCEAGAINYDRKPETVVEEVGAVVVATGYDLYGQQQLGEYGLGEIEDVVDGLQFERLCSASGPTKGKILRPSDHQQPKDVVFIQCAGSRDPARHCSWCSKICCMYTAKHAKLFKHQFPEGRAYVFYIDIRSGGKGYEEFVQGVMEHDEVVYLRGRVSRVYRDGDKVRVFGTDTLSGQNVEIAADMVVLALAMQPSAGTATIAKTLKISRDKDGFLSEAHPKLRPVESVTAGIFLAGAAQGPKDIPETVAQASAAAAKAIGLLSQPLLSHSPTVAQVQSRLCTGCRMCVDTCPYDAIALVHGKATVTDVLCEGCGSCVASCLRSAIQVKNSTPLQIKEMIETVLRV